MHIKEIRALSDDELLNKLEDKKHEMWVLRRDRMTGELKDLNRVRYTKRDIARIQTALRERQLAVQVASKEKGNG